MNLPDHVHLHDERRAWRDFILLETFRDGMSGAWDPLKVFGKPWEEMESPRAEDAMTIKRLARIIERQQAEKDKAQHGNRART